MKYGFIGCGNMGGAIAKALSRSTKDILLSDPSPKARELAQELGCQYGNNMEVVSSCDRIFLAIKPQIMASVLQPLSTVLSSRKPLIITMAAGLEISKVESFIGTSLPVIRIMPNTPVAVGKGMILYCSNKLVKETDKADFLVDMRHAGTLDQLDEKLIDVGSALSGSGPAYMYYFMEAMAAGAAEHGLSFEKAIIHAAVTMEGAAQMVLETGRHPKELKDAVCSPGGSTIEGLRALEKQDFFEAVTGCISAAYKRNLELGK